MLYAFLFFVFLDKTADHRANFVYKNIKYRLKQTNIKYSNQVFYPLPIHEIKWNT